jgi:hypothetical protein
MTRQKHAPGTERRGLAVDIKLAHLAGNQLENRLFAELEGFFTKDLDQFLFHKCLFLIFFALLYNIEMSF